MAENERKLKAAHAQIDAQAAEINNLKVIVNQQGQRLVAMEKELVAANDAATKNRLHAEDLERKEHEARIRAACPVLTNTLNRAGTPPVKG